jgi:adenylosuccinate lyase
MARTEYRVPDPDHSNTAYESPFSGRYGSDRMRRIWSEDYKWELATRIWVAAARAFSTVGVVSPAELADLENFIGCIDPKRVVEIEKVTVHDIVAAIRAYAEHAQVGGRIIHLAMTSEDMSSNMDVMRIIESVGLIDAELERTLLAFADRIEATASMVCMGWSHQQPAEPSTVGYRLARYAQNFLYDRTFLKFVGENMEAKGMKGAVGTAASFAQQLKGTGLSPRQFEALVMEELGLNPALITGQLAPRKLEAWASSALASIGGSLYEFGNNFRTLQSPPYGEWEEGRKSTQVGSSAMPWKRNPIGAEGSAGLGRGIIGDMVNMYMMAQTQVLERGIDDSGDRRVTIPTMFFRAEQGLKGAAKVAAGMTIFPRAVDRNLRQYGVFSVIELLIIDMVERGADRQEVHERTREISNRAFEDVKEGLSNPLQRMLAQDPFIQGHGVSEADIDSMFRAVLTHVGDAPERSLELVEKIRATCG